MDAQYLVNNVNSALTEALSAMVTSQPGDSIEFVGKYLLQYVERQKRLEAEAARVVEVEALAEQEVELEKTAAAAAFERKRDTEMYEAKFSTFAETFAASSNSKQNAMENATNFIADYFRVPACYVGVVKKNGENECLHYFGANKGQEHILGKKLMKPVEEGEDAPLGQGISFNAFKIPEVPEEEPVEVAEGEEPPPPKPAPTAQPLVVDDVMRDPGIKFFGIPKIGSYVAIPTKYNTLDHDAAVTVGAAGEFTPNPVPQQVLFCMDTIGKYRELTAADVAGAQQIAELLVATWETQEEAMFTKHCSFLNDFKAANSAAQAVSTKAGDAETAALASVAGSLPEDAADALKAWKEAEASLKSWTEAIGDSEAFADSIMMLTNHLLPAIPCVGQLFYAVAVFCGVEPKSCRDVCGDVTWEVARTCVLPRVVKQMLAFDPLQVRLNVLPDAGFNDVKKFTEDNNLFDVSIYPPTLAVCNTLAVWLQKAVAARGAAIAYQLENGVKLE